MGLFGPAAMATYILHGPPYVRGTFPGTVAVSYRLGVLVRCESSGRRQELRVVAAVLVHDELFEDLDGGPLSLGERFWVVGRGLEDEYHPGRLLWL